MTTARAAGRRGFTLIEALAALVISGMAAALLTDALFRAFDARARLQLVAQRSEEIDLVSEWWRDTVEATVEPRADRAGLFRGRADGFSGLTLAPLDDAFGAAQPYAWRFAEDGDGSLLIYEGRDGAPLTVMRFEGRARFSYWSAQDGWHDVWPPQARPEERRPPLMVAAVVTEAGAAAPIIAARSADGRPRESFEDRLRRLGNRS